MDREKVIKGLRCIKGDTILCRECDYADVDGYGNYSCKINCAIDAIELLKEQPQIVRCKDCKHKEESVSPSWEAWCNRLHCVCDLDWFCADGERKEND